MTRSLRSRTLLLLLLLLLVVFVPLGILLSHHARSLAADAIAERTAVESRALAASGSAGSADWGDAARAILSPDSFVLILDVHGTTLYTNEDSPSQEQASAPEIRAALLTGQPARAVRSTSWSRAPVQLAAAPIRSGDAITGVVRVSAPRDALSAAARAAALRVALFGLVLAAALAVGAWRLGTLIQRTSDHLSTVAHRVAAGALEERAGMPTFAEAEGLTRAVNDMAHSLALQVRQSLRERDTRSAILNSMADGLLAIDRDGAVVLANAAAQALFPGGPDGITGQRFMTVVRDHDIQRLVRTALDTGRRQAALVGQAPELKRLHVSATPLPDHAGLSAIVLFQDQSELHRLESVRREFVTNVSHELRTPLASIKAAVETLQGGASQDPVAGPDFLQRIGVEVDHLVALVQRLLNLSRLETGRVQFDFAALDLSLVLAEAVNRLRPQAERLSITLTLDIPPGLPPSWADRAALHEIVLNLLSNAIKFTSPGGTISVSARQDAGMLEIAVSDSGKGIAPEDLPHIFERFYKADRSRSSPGAGLGLSLARHIVLGHGGRAWAESPPGHGATFRFTLPQAPASAPATKTPQPS